MQKNPFWGALEGSGLGQVPDFDDFKYPFPSSGHQILQDRKNFRKQKSLALMRAWRSAASDLVYELICGLWSQKTDFQLLSASGWEGLFTRNFQGSFRGPCLVIKPKHYLNMLI